MSSLVRRAIVKPRMLQLTGASVCLVATVWAATAFGQDAEAGPRKHGLLLTSKFVSPGFTLLAPLSSRQTYLIDNEGKVVHSWVAEAKPGNSAALLEDGSLLRCARVVETHGFLTQGGVGGRIQRFDWDGNLLWDFVYADAEKMHHHDVEWMPNGNVLLIAWERKTKAAARAAGRSAELLTDTELWPEVIVEIQPQGKTGGREVWKWKLWDHLIQNKDESKPGFGDPAQHPELVDINYCFHTRSDWVHMNSIRYSQELDQILVSCNYVGEVWIIDHSTTTLEAAGHTGGKSGKGGDLLYRWGNAAAYLGPGSPAPRFEGQHDARWVPKGSPGAGNILLFCNEVPGDSERFSSVVEFTPPLREDGSYRLSYGTGYGPERAVWAYADPSRIFSAKISGAQRLPNGNTLICSGMQGLLVEVTPQGKAVWAYGNRPRQNPKDNSATGEEADDDVRPNEKLIDRDIDPFENDEAIAPAGDEGSKDLAEAGQGTPRGPFGALVRAGRSRLGIPAEGGGTLFRATKYPPDYPAFKGRNLGQQPSPKPTGS